MDKETLITVFTSTGNIKKDIRESLFETMFLKNIKKIVEYFEDITEQELYDYVYNKMDNHHIIQQDNQLYSLFLRSNNIDKFGLLFKNNALMVFLYYQKKSLLFKILFAFCREVHNTKGYDRSQEEYAIISYLEGIFNKEKYYSFCESEIVLIIGEALRIVNMFDYEDCIQEKYDIEINALGTLDYQLLKGDYSYESYSLYIKYIDDIDNSDLSGKDYHALMKKDLKELIDIYNSDEKKPVIYWFTVLHLICTIFLEVDKMFDKELGFYIDELKTICDHL